MGKRGGWFSAVKRALSSDSSDKKDQKPYKSKRKWFGKGARPASDTVLSPRDVKTLPVAVLAPPSPPPPLEDLKLAKVEDEQSKHAYSVALATAVAAEAAVAAAQAAAEVVRLTSSAGRYSGKSLEEIAAIKIQTVFRGYMARRAFRALRGLVRLKTLIGGQSVKRQAATTLRYMQTLARLQLQVRARRIRMSEENLALQRQLQHKHEKEIEKLRLPESWNDSTQSKEQMEANSLHRQEAGIRRERALAYAFSHQNTWKNSKPANQMFMDPSNPNWGWSWLERWTASRPWEARTTAPSKTNDRASIKSGGATPAISVREIIRSHSSCLGLKKPPSSISPKTTRARSQHYHSPSTPTSNDSRSMFSVKSEMVRRRRHSIAGSSSVRDDESLMSMPAVPGYMALTMSAKAKSRVPTSPLRIHDNGTTTTTMPQARKRLSFSPSPGDSIVGARRHSGPPKVDSSIIIIKGLGM